MDGLFTTPVIVALTVVALINIGLLIVAWLAGKEETYNEPTEPKAEPTGLRVPPRSYIHWSEHPPLEHECPRFRVTPPASLF